MTVDELKELVKARCPIILSSKNVMDKLAYNYCDTNLDPNIKLTHDEFVQYDIIVDIITSATVETLINHLKTNYKPEDKLCYMDYVQGLKNDCTYVTKDQLGKIFFYTVLDLKKEAARVNGTTLDMEDIYPYVTDKDVVVI